MSYKLLNGIVNTASEGAKMGTQSSLSGPLRPLWTAPLRNFWDGRRRRGKGRRSVWGQVLCAEPVSTTASLTSPSFFNVEQCLWTPVPQWEDSIAPLAEKSLSRQLCSHVWGTEHCNSPGKGEFINFFPFLPPPFRSLLTLSTSATHSHLVCSARSGLLI